MKKTLPSSALARIRALSGGLSPKLQGIAAHLTDHPQDVVHLSISELADVTHSSEATIFRLCRQLGYKGYQDLKIALAGELVEEPTRNIHEDVLPEDGMMTVAHKIFHANILGITDTLQVLDEAALEEAVRLLNGAKRVCIYAIGGSAVVADDAYHKFMRTGVQCVAHSDSHLQAMTAALLDRECVAFGISHSGSNKDVLEAFKIAKAAGAKTIALTSYRKSPLAQQADVNLYTSTRETSFRTEAIAARIAQLCIVDALYVGLALARREETLRNLQKVREVISAKRI